jgi:hypothetical protein
MADDDFFRARLDHVIDMLYPLAVLAGVRHFRRVFAHFEGCGLYESTTWRRFPDFRVI